MKRFTLSLVTFCTLSSSFLFPVETIPSPRVTLNPDCREMKREELNQEEGKRATIFPFISAMYTVPGIGVSIRPGGFEFSVSAGTIGFCHAINVSGVALIQSSTGTGPYIGAGLGFMSRISRLRYADAAITVPIRAGVQIDRAFCDLGVNVSIESYRMRGFRAGDQMPEFRVGVGF